MKKLIIFLKLLFVVSVFSKSAIADELRDFLMQQIEGNEYQPALYADEYQMYVVNFMEVGDHAVIPKAELEGLVAMWEIAKSNNMSVTTKSFNILSRSETQNFISATWEYEFEVSWGDLQYVVEHSGISVLLKTDEGYIHIFGAMTGDPQN